jgi:hypothetical protein
MKLMSYCQGGVERSYETMWFGEEWMWRLYFRDEELKGGLDRKDAENNCCEP